MAVPRSAQQGTFPRLCEDSARSPPRSQRWGLTAALEQQQTLAEQHLRTLAQNDLDSFRNTTLANVGMKLNEMQMDFWLAQMDKAHKFMRRQLGLNN